METYEQKGVKLISALIAAFPDGIWPIGGAAVAGNGGEESGGLNPVEEAHPLAAGLRGYGWFQDTGPRRVSFFAWCAANNLSPNSDDGNIGYLIHELKTTYAHVLPLMAADPSLDGKTKIFMDNFERPNAAYAHLEVRRAFAKRAYDAWLAHTHADPTSPAPVPAPAPGPAAPQPAQGKTPMTNFLDPIRDALDKADDLVDKVIGQVDAFAGFPVIGAILAPYISLVNEVKAIADLARAEVDKLDPKVAAAAAAPAAAPAVKA